MKFLLLLTCAFSLPLRAAAQQADNWYFGVRAGLNFSDTVPVVLTDGALITPEGCSAVSDSTGSLLFYTDGITIWNKLHAAMPNGNGLNGGSSCTQAALIAKQPGNNGLYYVFTLDEIGGPLGFRYSIVDMNLSGGLGDVIEKNVLLLDSVTEKLTAVTNINGTVTWVVVHGWGTNAFYAYALSGSGIDTSPVVSYSGMVHTTAQIQNTYGQMKFAGCGGRLALAAGYLDTVELFDFHLADGTVTNPITIPMSAHVYGVEFSPDDSKLYVTCYNPEGTLMQFDLLQGDASAIINSKVTLNSTADLYALQLAPDGKIYVVRSYSAMLGIINHPDTAGRGCDFVLNGINLDPAYTGASAALGLPNFVQSDFDDYHKGCATPTTINGLMAKDKMQVFPNPANDYLLLNSDSFGANPIEILITDLTGRIVRSVFVTHHGTMAHIDVSSLDSGVYLLQVLNSKVQLIQKIMVTGHR